MINVHEIFAVFSEKHDSIAFFDEIFSSRIIFRENIIKKNLDTNIYIYIYCTGYYTHKKFYEKWKSCFCTTLRNTFLNVFQKQKRQGKIGENANITDIFSRKERFPHFLVRDLEKRYAVYIALFHDSYTCIS